MGYTVTETAEALFRFFGGFDLPVYSEDGVPGTARPPYITIRLIDPDWRTTASYYARIWYRSATPAEVFAKADEIGAAIGEGVCIPTAHGSVVLGKGANFAQKMAYEGDPALQCVYLDMVLQALTP